MALVDSSLSASLKKIYLDQYKGTPSAEQEEEMQKMADQMASAISAFIKTATVNVISVAGVTVGSGVSGAGTGTLT